jgi:hypothetical protein
MLYEKHRFSIYSRTVHPWLRQLHHDLVKRLLWAARDCRACGIAPTPGELLPALFDEEGQQVTPLLLWQTLKLKAPANLDLTCFETTLKECLLSAERNDLEGVLRLEAAFVKLEQSAEAIAIDPGLAPSLKGDPH